MIGKKRLFLSLIILSLVLLLFVSCDIFTRPNKTEHICSYDDVQVISPIGCTTDGIIMRSCFCGRETTEITPATGHTLGEWSTVVEANCSTPGKEESTCSVCGYVQSHAVARTEHSYEITDEIIEGKKYNRYTCLNCSESFLLEDGFAPPETEGATYLTNKSSAYSFIVISAEGEEYIKDHLRIINYYYIDSDIESAGEVEYKITNIGGFKWIISPEESYAMGQTYIAMRTEGVYFEEYGFSDLVFSIVNEKKDSISVVDGIIYVGALEKESPGYYPYSIEFSTGSGEYFISLEKADGLEVDDYICIGSATCFEDIVDKHMTATFGVITSIAALDDGRMLIMLREMKFSELFSSLEYNSSGVEHSESLTLPINEADRFKSQLLGDRDFQNYLSLIYTTAEEYLASRGLTMNLKDFEEFVDSLTVTAEQIGRDQILLNSLDTTDLTVKLTMDISIPAFYEFWSVGTLGATATLEVTVSITDSNIYISEDSFSPEESRAFLSFDITKNLTSSFGLNTWSEIEYFFNQNIIVRETSGGEYHFKGCKNLIEVGRENIDNLTISELYKEIINGKAVLECEGCRPITELCENMYLLDTSDMIVHTPLCSEIDLKDERTLLFSEKTDESLTEEGYTLCRCHSDRGEGGFRTLLLEKTKLGEYGEYADLFDGEGAGLNEITIGAFAITHSGIDRELIFVRAMIDFRIEESVEYTYTLTEETKMGLRSTLEGLKAFEIKGERSIYTEGLGHNHIDASVVNADSNLILYIAGFIPDMVE